MGWTSSALLPERTAILGFLALLVTDVIYRVSGFNLEDAPFVDAVRLSIIGGVLVIAVVTSPHHLPAAIEEIVEEGRGAAE